MEKTVSILFIVASCCVGLSIQNKCTSGPGNLEVSNIMKMNETCYQSLESQIKREFDAMLTYWAMSVHFSQGEHFRPNVAKYFIDQASEERKHGILLIDYLLMRGGVIEPEAFQDIKPINTKWSNLADAMKEALDLEIKFRSHFIEILKLCEDGKDNDYHAVDYVTGKFLEEQHQGIRQISGYYANLKKMTEKYGTFSEVMFDNTFKAS